MTSCLFFGTPEFALPALAALASSPYELKAVVTRPDQQAGRGRRPQPPPVKAKAIELGIPVLQPRRLRDPEALEALRDMQPDFIVVAAYGLLVPPDLLALPPYGVLNIHPSLLPRHRGASPIPAAILAGDDVTGASIMLMDAGLDTGPVLAQRSVAIDPRESAGELSKRLAPIAADLLLATLPQWLEGRLEPIRQDDNTATYSPQLTRADALLSWPAEAERLWRQVRAYNPWPGAETYLAGSRLKIWRAWPLGGTEQPPGRVVAVETVETGWGPRPAVVVACGVGHLALVELQREGRRALAADEFARGERSLVGAILGGAMTG